jgi:hypothetical protein
MKAELAIRNIEFPENGGIRKLNELLKKHLKEKWTTTNPGVAESVYDENEDFAKFFHPETGRASFLYEEVQQKKK